MCNAGLLLTSQWSSFRSQRILAVKCSSETPPSRPSSSRYLQHMTSFLRHNILWLVKLKNILRLTNSFPASLRLGHNLTLILLQKVRTMWWYERTWRLMLLVEGIGTGFLHPKWTLWDPVVMFHHEVYWGFTLSQATKALRESRGIALLYFRPLP